MGGAALLDVDPANAINFDLVIGKTLESTLVIRNPRSSSIVFKVKTTAPKRYCVRPNCCLVRAGEQVEVKIIMQALKEIPPADQMWKDKFLIQAGYAASAGENADPKEVFEQLDKDALHDQKLLCSFTSAAEADTASSATMVAKPVSSSSHTVTRAAPKAAQRQAPPIPEAESDSRGGHDAQEDEGAASMRKELAEVQHRQELLQKQLVEEKSLYHKRLRTLEGLQKKFESLQTNQTDNKKESGGTPTETAATAVKPAASPLNSTLLMVFITLLTLLGLKMFLPAASE